MQRSFATVNAPSLSSESGSGGLNIEQHPNLPSSEGIADHFSTLPKDKQEQLASAEYSPELSNKLKHGMSFEAAREEHKKKFKQKLKKVKKLEQKRRPTPRLTR